MSSPRDDLVYVEDMLARIRRVLARTEGVTWERFRDDEDLHDIAERCISIIGEAASRVSAAFRDAHPQVPWSEAAAIRHKIVHDYFQVSYTVLWSVVREELPELERVLAEVLDEGRASAC